MRESGRMRAVTLPHLRRCGAESFGWVHPDEQVGSATAAASQPSTQASTPRKPRPLSSYGAFLYTFSSGAPIIFHMINPGVILTAQQEARAQIKGIERMNNLRRALTIGQSMTNVHEEVRATDACVIGRERARYGNAHAEPAWRRAAGQAGGSAEEEQGFHLSARGRCLHQVLACLRSHVGELHGRGQASCRRGGQIRGRRAGAAHFQKESVLRRHVTSAASAACTQHIKLISVASLTWHHSLSTF